MGTFQKFLTVLMSWFVALLKLFVAISLLGIAKVTLRTNPELAIAVLSAAAGMFLLWYFLPQIKKFFK